ncbi:MAG: PD-(D/E)XK nuclease family protein [Deltaproteobacteria bacterium]|nr:PD-(D/E)XK nuclease family protein [Deltaproteobacteria bacterium]
MSQKTSENTETLKSFILGDGSPNHAPAVITNNNRLSKYILSLHASWMEDKGISVFETPNVMPISVWAKTMWRSAFEEGNVYKPLLSLERSRALWTKVILNSKYKDNFSKNKKNDFSPQDLTSLLSFEAYSLLYEYDAELPEEIYLPEEASALKQWMSIFREELEALGFIDTPSLITSLSGAVKQGKVKLPESVLVAGFDTLVPDLEKLLEELCSAGVSVNFWPREPKLLKTLPTLEDKNKVEVFEFNSPEEEIRLLAKWVREVKKPGERIGILAPSLEQYRSLLRRELSFELDPSSALLGSEDSELFNLTVGSALSDEPIISACINLLEVVFTDNENSITSLSEAEVGTEDFVRIFASPFVTNKRERLALYALDRDYKNKKRESIELETLRDACSVSVVLQAYGEGLGAFLEKIKDIENKKEVASFWSEYFDSLLTLLGWPKKGCVLSIPEQEALKIWKDFLESFSALDDILGQVTGKVAFQTLRREAGLRAFNPEQEEQEIEVLSFEGASVIEFDRIWILGANDANLPAPANPNSFLPINLQREVGVKGSSGELNLDYAKSSLGRILKNAPLVNISYAKVVDGREVGLSPLIHFNGEFSTLKEEKGSDLITLMQDVAEDSEFLEVLKNEELVPLGTKELETMRGGTSIIKNQSACPFRAFAIHRLNATTLEELTLGFDGRDRGTNLHLALKIFWEKVKDLKKLSEIIEDNTLESVIKDSAMDAMRAVKKEGPLSRTLVELEVERLIELMKKWLEVEAKRDGFKVKGLEKERLIKVGELTLKVYIDRIDELEDGSEVVIDYKSGNCSVSDWNPKQLKEPQLLIYGKDGDFDAFAFARVKIKGTSFIGLSRSKDSLPNIKKYDKSPWREEIEGIDSWEDLRTLWNETLETLARDFEEGKNEVTPAVYKTGQGLKGAACEYCELPLLCRIFESESSSD